MLQLLTLITLLTASTTVSATSKRGLCHVPSKKHPNDDTIWISTPGANLSWYYNYQYEPSPAFKPIKEIHFVPQLWGAHDYDTGTPFLDAVKRQIEDGDNITHVLGFNEPDGITRTGGSSIAVPLAVQTWKDQIAPLRELGVKLGAPGVTGSERGLEWLEEFFEQCGDECQVDFMQVHWYGDFQGLADHVGHMVARYPDKPVWITEWGWPHEGLEETQEFFRESVAMFDRWKNVTHYSYFGAFRSDVSNIGPNASMLTEQGVLTDIGSWYLNGDATGNIPQGGVDDLGNGSNTTGVSWGQLCWVVGVTLGSIMFLGL